MYSLVSIMFVASKKKLLFSFSHRVHFLKTNSFGDGHLGFPIPVKNVSFLMYHPMTIYVQLGSIMFVVSKKIAFISTFP